MQIGALADMMPVFDVMEKPFAPLLTDDDQIELFHWGRLAV